MPAPKPVLAVFYPGGRRPHALKCAMRDYAEGLCHSEPKVVDKGAIWTMRSKIARGFLERTDAEWLLMIDGDMQWEPSLLPILGELVCETRGVLGCLVSKDCKGQGLATDLPSGTHERIADGSKRLVETPGVIGSPTAIHREALVRTIERWTVVDPAKRTADPREVMPCTDGYEHWHSLWMPFVRWSEQRQCWIERADDAAFCERAQGAGVPTHVAIGQWAIHWGEYPYDFRDGLNL